MPPLILGSASARRHQILQMLGVDHEQITSSYNEDSFVWQSDYHASIIELAKAKAEPLACDYPKRTIVSADTIVVIDGRRLGKPKNGEMATEYLQLLQGRYHEVLTAICVYHEGHFSQALDITRVKMTPLQPAQILQYIQTPVPYDKAGGYAIQGIGGLLVEQIEGCFYNVMGLPVLPLMRLLQPTGYDLWQSACSSSHTY